MKNFSFDRVCFPNMLAFRSHDPNLAQDHGASTSGTPSHRDTPNASPSESLGINSYFSKREKELRNEIAAIRLEIAEYDEEVQKIQTLRAVRIKDEEEVLSQLEALKQRRRTGAMESLGFGKAKDEIDYSGDWEWSKQLQAKLKNVFGFDNFRMCQKRLAVLPFIQCHPYSLAEFQRL